MGSPAVYQTLPLLCPGSLSWVLDVSRWLGLRLGTAGMDWGCSLSPQSPLPDTCLGGCSTPGLAQPGCAELSHLLTLCLSQDGVMVLSATHRYKKKYVTTLLYKPI